MNLLILTICQEREAIAVKPTAELVERFRNLVLLKEKHKLLAVSQAYTGEDITFYEGDFALRQFLLGALDQEELDEVKLSMGGTQISIHAEGPFLRIQSDDGEKEMYSEHFTLKQLEFSGNKLSEKFEKMTRRPEKVERVFRFHYRPRVLRDILGGFSESNNTGYGWHLKCKETDLEFTVCHTKASSQTLKEAMTDDGYLPFTIHGDSKQFKGKENILLPFLQALEVERRKIIPAENITLDSIREEHALLKQIKATKKGLHSWDLERFPTEYGVLAEYDYHAQIENLQFPKTSFMMTMPTYTRCFQITSNEYGMSIRLRDKVVREVLSEEDFKKAFHLR